MESAVVGLLGGGQLGRMLIEAANRLNIRVNVLDAPNSPAMQISGHDGHVHGSFKDQKCIEALAKSANVLTIEIEHVDTKALQAVAGEVPIEPSWQTIRIIQDKYQQKEHLSARGVALAEYEELQNNTESEVKRIAEKFGYPLMLKSKTQAYDGRGNAPVQTAGDIQSALESLADRPLYAEKWAPFTCELAVMVVKTASNVLTFPCVETVHEDSICKLTYAPPRSVTLETRTAAEDLARKAVAAFDGKGVFGVEMFHLADGTLLVNEIAPRPHNSGHYTIEACSLSQYDTHLRAILDLPINPSSLNLNRPAIMLNILGGADPKSHLQLATHALSVPGASVHLYGKGDARPGRKMGHITVTAATLPQAEAAIAPLIALADQIRAQRRPGADTKAPVNVADAGRTAAPPPVVGVTMGSNSDLPTLEPGLAVLRQLKIPFETRVTSAHRTPAHMAAYATSAAQRGLKVLITAAGGAAHLPGMTAAYTALPVIGVPVRAGASTDGMDALLSIVMMPRGVPVATVGVGNAVNAALLAARILGTSDEAVRERVVTYAREAERKALESDQELLNGHTA